MQAIQKITTLEMRQAQPVPKSTGMPMLGSVPQLLQKQMNFFVDAWKEHGDIYELDLGLLSAIVVNHPDYAQHILRDNWRNYGKGGEMYDSIRTFTGTSVLTIEGNAWKRRRRMMQPQFHRQHLAGLTELMVEAIDECFDEWEKYAESGESFDISSAFNKITMTVILRAMFGRDLKADSLDKLGDTLRYVIDYILVLLVTGKIPEWIPFTGRKRYQVALDEFDTFIYDIIQQRRNSPDEGNDLMAMLLNMVDDETGEPLSDKELRDEVATIFAAGYETTSVAMTWALYQLAENRDIAEKLAHSVDETLEGKLPAFEDFRNLDYTRQVMEETMRMYPPAYFIPRQAIDRDIIGGHRIEAGQLVFVMTLLIHQHPDFWDNPEVFDPERFAEESSRHPLAYMPFGAGQRLCIGKDFAMMEGTLILSQFMQRYRTYPVIGKKPETALSTTLGNKDGVWVTIAKR